MYGDRVFLVAGLQLWNELPLDIRTISDVNAFKTSLKTFLFRQAYFEYLWARIFTFVFMIMLLYFSYYKVVFIRIFFVLY